MDLGDHGQKEGDGVEEATAGIRGAATAEGAGIGQWLTDDSRGHSKVTICRSLRTVREQGREGQGRHAVLQACYAPGGRVRGMWNRVGRWAPEESEDR